MRLKGIVSLVILTFFVSSCGMLGGSSSDESPTTGWQYNDPEMGGFEVKAKQRQKETFLEIWMVILLVRLWEICILQHLPLKLLARVYNLSVFCMI